MTYGLWTIAYADTTQPVLQRQPRRSESGLRLTLSPSLTLTLSHPHSLPSVPSVPSLPSDEASSVSPPTLRLGGEVPVRPRKDEERRKGKREKAKGKREKGEKEKGKKVKKSARAGSNRHFRKWPCDHFEYFSLRRPTIGPRGTHKPARPKRSSFASDEGK